MTCHAGCETERVVADLDLDMSDLFVKRDTSTRQVTAIYPYRDEDGVLL